MLLNPPLGNSFLLEKASFSCYPGASILGAEGRGPHILGRGSCGGVVGVVDGS